jgi:predicted amidohydrolase
MKAAAVQFNHKPGDKTANWETVEGFIREAADLGVELLVFPEMCITGYWHVHTLERDDIEALAEPVPSGDSTRRLVDHAKRTGMTIGVGLIEIDEAGRLFNSFVVALPDGMTHCHRKIHTFINPLFDSGDSFTTFTLPSGRKAGILTCYDNNIIENVRANALLGVEIMLAPHQTGGCLTPSPHCMGQIDVALWENRASDPEAIEAEFRGPKGRAWLMKWLPARAHDNGMFYLFSNGVGRDGDEVRTGNSMLLDPYGSILAETWAAADTMVVAEFDLKLLDRSVGRRWIRTRRPELYRSLTEKTGVEEDVKQVRFEGLE